MNDDDDKDRHLPTHIPMTSKVAEARPCGQSKGKRWNYKKNTGNGDATPDMGRLRVG